MYITGANEKIQLVLAGAITTNQLQWTASYQTVDGNGMTLPMLSAHGVSNDTTDVDVVAAAGVSKTNQITYLSVYNADTVSATVTIKLDSSGTERIIRKALLQAGDTLEFSREFGWKINTGTSQDSYILTEFTSSGTWIKPQGLVGAWVAVVGAGGGAGSGRQGAAGENRFGGGGGGGGAIVWRYIDAGSLPSSVVVTIGTGGAGGAAQASTSSNGNAGTAGGDSSFGGLINAKGGNSGGGGGTTAGTAGTGGQSSASTPAYSPFSLSGGNGPAGNTTTNAAGGVGFLSTAAPGGGGGGGISSANALGTAANSGGGVYENGVVQAGPTSGASPNGVDDVCTILFPFSTMSSVYGIGTAGAGNNPATPNGGNGGRCAGGGGGAGTLNGTSSGKGGDGGNGLCIVLEIY